MSNRQARRFDTRRKMAVILDSKQADEKQVLAAFRERMANLNKRIQAVAPGAQLWVELSEWGLTLNDDNTGMRLSAHQETIIEHVATQWLEATE